MILRYHQLLRSILLRSKKIGPWFLLDLLLNCVDFLLLYPLRHDRFPQEISTPMWRHTWGGRARPQVWRPRRPPGSLLRPPWARALSWPWEGSSVGESGLGSRVSWGAGSWGKTKRFLQYGDIHFQIAASAQNDATIQWSQDFFSAFFYYKRLLLIMITLSSALYFYIILKAFSEYGVLFML